MASCSVSRPPDVRPYACSLSVRIPSMHSTVRTQHIPNRQNTAAANMTVLQEWSRKEKAGCFAHGAAAQLQVSLTLLLPTQIITQIPPVPCICIILQPSPCVPQAAGHWAVTPWSYSISFPQRSVQCQELTANKRPSGNFAVSASCYTPEFLLYVYNPPQECSADQFQSL